MKEISQCEVCGNRNLRQVLDLGKHPLCDDLVPIGSDRRCVEYPIEVLFCDRCLTAHQRYQVPSRTLFTDTYHYRARVTGSVLSGMAELVSSCELKLGSLGGRTVLDVGCNDGSLLNYFSEKGCRTIGIEPTAAADESRHTTIKAFFDRASVERILQAVGQPQIITFTNVFAHIENLPELIENLGRLISRDTVVVIENHYLGAILDYGQFDTFYHEHPRTYSYQSFRQIATSLGLNVTDVQFVSRYGGNIRVYLSLGKPSDLEVNERHFSQMFTTLGQSVAGWSVAMRRRIDGLSGQFGPLRAKAFPGRAAILIKLLDLDERSIAAVYEIRGSKKVGHYVPSTRIPILPEADLFALPDQTLPILNLAWHIPDEVRANLRSHGYQGEVVNIKDFVLQPR